MRAIKAWLRWIAGRPLRHMPWRGSAARGKVLKPSYQEMAERNDAVRDYRLALSNEIASLYRREIDVTYAALLRRDRTATYPDAEWRWRELESVSYSDMMQEPWRPLTSYYREGFPTAAKGAR